MTTLAPAATACCSTLSVGSAVVTMPVTDVVGLPAVKPSTVSVFRATPIADLMRSRRACAVSEPGPAVPCERLKGTATAVAARPVNSRRV